MGFIGDDSSFTSMVECRIARAKLSGRAPSGPAAMLFMPMEETSLAHGDRQEIHDQTTVAA